LYADDLLLISSTCNGHRLCGSASPVLTATGFVNGKGQFSTSYRIDTPSTDQKKLSADYVGDPMALTNKVHIRPRGASGHMGEI